MKWGISIRALVLARRGVRALESIAESQHSLASIEEARELRSITPPQVRIPRPLEVGIMDIAEVNKKWKKERIVAGQLEDDE